MTQKIKLLNDVDKLFATYGSQLNYSDIWLEEEEEAAHVCLEEAAGNLKYACDNYHKNQRSGELGRDLVWHKKSEKIIFAVKKRPVKNDLKQLKEFSKRTADKRVYVYLREPTISFRKSMRTNKLIEFYGPDKFHMLLVLAKSTEYIRIFLRSSPIVRAMAKTYLTIIKTGKTKPSVPSDCKVLEPLWLVKDRTTALHRQLSLNYAQWDDQTKDEIRLTPEILHNYLLKILQDHKIIYEQVGETFVWYFKDLANQYPSAVSYMMMKGKSASTTSWLFARACKFKDDKKIYPALLDFIVDENHSMGPLSKIKYILENLANNGHYFEDFTDWAFEEYMRVPK